MNDLGRLEDLPVDYVQALREQNLVPLWPSLRAVLPPTVPTRQTRALSCEPPVFPRRGRTMCRPVSQWKRTA